MVNGLLEEVDTVTRQVFEMPATLQVMFAVPVPTALTRPLELTVATAVLLLFQVAQPLLVVSAGL